MAVQAAARPTSRPTSRQPSRPTSRPRTKPQSRKSSQLGLTRRSSKGSLPPLKSEDLDYDQIIKLFASRHSFDLADRHVAALEQVCKHNQNGYCIADLPVIKQLLNYGRYWIGEGKTQYIDVMSRLVKLCSLPFRKTRASEEYRNFDEVCTFVEALGALTEVDVPVLQVEAAAALHDFAAAGRPSSSPLQGGVVSSNGEVVVTPSNTNLRVLECSGVVCLVIQGLRLATEPIAQFALVRTLREFSFSEENCYQMTKALLPELLGEFLLTNDDKLLFLVIELLWNLLESDSDAHEQLNSLEAFAALKDLLVALSAQCHRKMDRELANEVLIVCTLLANSGQIDPDIFVASDLTRTLLTMTVALELSGADSKARANICTAEQAEFKQLAHNLILTLTSDPHNLSVIISGRFMDYLVLFLKDESAASLRWTQHQYRELQLQVLSVLFHVVPEAPAEFSESDGLRALLTFFVANKSDAELKHGVVKVLVNSCSLFQAQLGNLGAVSVLLATVQDVENAPELRRDAVLALANLCNSRCQENQKEFGAEGGVSVLLPCLRFDANDPYRQPALVLAAVDCVWTAVVGCPENEDMFLSMDGAYELLGLLEECPYSMRNHVLGTCLDLMAHPSMPAMVIRWRSDKDVTRGITHLLVDCWKKEQEMLGVAVDDGVIASVVGPIAPAMAEDAPSRASSRADATPEEQSVWPPPTADMSAEVIPYNEPSFAIMDVSLNMRAKIFGMCAKLGFENLAELPVEDRLHLMLIKHYVEYKGCEVWGEIEAELRVEGVRPTTPDSARIAMIRSEGVESATLLRHEQWNALHVHREEVLRGEAQAYQTVIRAQAAARGLPSDVVISHIATNESMLGGPPPPRGVPMVSDEPEMDQGATITQPSPGDAPPRSFSYFRQPLSARMIVPVNHPSGGTAPRTTGLSLPLTSEGPAVSNMATNDEEDAGPLTTRTELDTMVEEDSGLGSTARDLPNVFTEVGTPGAFETDIHGMDQLDMADMMGNAGEYLD